MKSVYTEIIIVPTKDNKIIIQLQIKDAFKLTLRKWSRCTIILKKSESESEIKDLNSVLCMVSQTLVWVCHHYLWKNRNKHSIFLNIETKAVNKTGRSYVIVY